MKRIYSIAFAVALQLSVASAFAANLINLSGDGWQAKLDPEAEWRDDTLYLPKDLPADLAELPYNAPTGGWECLTQGDVKDVSVPMTMDEYFSGGINTKTYEGVSWLWRTFDAPEDIDGKLLFLNVAKARMRAEIFINEELVAYDVVGETPFSFEVGRFIKAGEQNRIAVRLTNPGGRRGWNDNSDLFWGKYCFSSNGRNFSTLGDVEIAIKPQLYIDDIFVKNILPVNGKQVEVTVDIMNREGGEVNATIPIEVRSDKDGKKIASTTIKKVLKSGLNTTSFTMSLPKAKLWAPRNPNLYNLTAKLKSDSKSVRFGVKSFEVREGKSGGHNYYLNGERFIFKTAIDWGYYAPNGDYATPELAERNIDHALSMGQNGLSFHRHIGEPLVMKYADEKGLCIYEEQGGFHPIKRNKPGTIDTVGFTPDHIKEKIRRMIKRDRNHASVIIYSLSNEDFNFYSTREEAMRLINEMDDSRLIINTSGPHNAIFNIEHIRPHESEIRRDYLDRHTAYNRSPRYGDDDFYQEKHRDVKYEDRPYFLGEVNSVAGPENWYKSYQDILASGKVGYDTNIYKTNHDKIADGFERWNLSSVGSRTIQSPDDVSTQSGRGMMYAHARHAQSIMCNNYADGYALNGWTPGPMSEGDALDWSSGILDEARNIKAPADSYTYWAKPLQISLSRKNGKYFGVGEEVVIESNLINHNLLSAGDYKLIYSIVDGFGREVEFEKSETLRVEGGECYAQSIGDVKFMTDESWGAGYITLNAKLFKGDKEVASGSEQFLLKNRASYKGKFEGVTVDVRQWDEANIALTEAGATVGKGAKVIVVGDLTREDGKMSLNKINSWKQLDDLLAEVEDGANLIVRFDKYWAEVLYNKGILSEPVTEWGGNQTTEWLGNGWGYMDHFVGYESTANKGVIGTTSWEVPSDPYGFYPFESEYKMGVYGLYMCREWLCRIAPIGYRMKEVQPTMAVLMGTLDYGKGKIILNPCYHVDDEDAFSEMLFFNMVFNAQNGNY